MLLKFGVLEKESGEMHCYPDDVYVAMDEYAKQQAIAFGEWMAENARDPFCDGGWFYYIKSLPAVYAIDQLYTLFLNSK